MVVRSLSGGLVLRSTSLALLVVILAAGCSDKAAAPIPPAGMAGTPAAPAAPAAPGPPGGAPAVPGAPPGVPPGVPAKTIGSLPLDAPIIIVNGATFTRADLERTIMQHASVAGFPANSVDGRVRDAFESPAYEKMIERQLLLEEAGRRKLEARPEELAKGKAELVAQVPKGSTLEALLKTMRSDEAHFSIDMATDLAIERLLASIKKEIPKPDDAAVRKIYDANPASYRVPEAASLSHILVNLAPSADKADVDKAYDKAKALRALVDGKDAATFKKVAREKSEDPGAKVNGGDLGRVARGELLPELDKAAFTVKEGTVSEVVRSARGLHIVRGQGLTPGHGLSYDEVKEQIREREVTKVYVAQVDKLIEGLLASAKVQRLVEPLPSPLDSERPEHGSRVPAWRPNSGNAKDGAMNPHGGMIPASAANAGTPHGTGSPHGTDH